MNKKSIITVEELKKKFSARISKATAVLNEIHTNGTNELTRGWQSDSYCHLFFDDYDKNQAELLILHTKDNFRSYAIPVAYCLSDGTLVNSENYSNGKIFTLMGIISKSGDISFEFVSNVYTNYNNLRPDLKSIGFHKNFIIQTQRINDNKSYSFFNINQFYDELRRNEETKEKERRCQPMTITVGMWEDLMKKIKAIESKR